MIWLSPEESKANQFALLFLCSEQSKHNTDIRCKFQFDMNVGLSFKTMIALLAPFIETTGGRFIQVHLTHYIPANWGHTLPQKKHFGVEGTKNFENK